MSFVTIKMARLEKQPADLGQKHAISGTGDKTADGLSSSKAGLF
jgi:hypothetical protein